MVLITDNLEEERHYWCPACGLEVADDEEMCSSCGAILFEDDERGL